MRIRLTERLLSETFLIPLAPPVVVECKRRFNAISGERQEWQERKAEQQNQNDHN